MIVNMFSTSRSLVKRRIRTDIIAENRRAAGETRKALRRGKAHDSESRRYQGEEHSQEWQCHEREGEKEQGRKACLRQAGGCYINT